jgi:hypothetical protein
MFSLSKINFSTTETYFYIYGETSENETFISELKKFVKNIKLKDAGCWMLDENKKHNYEF